MFLLFVELMKIPVAYKINNLYIKNSIFKIGTRLDSMEKSKKNHKISIKKEWCKGCAICVEFCPQDVLGMNGAYAEVVNLEACTACGLCEIRCPDFAITVEKGD